MKTVGIVWIILGIISITPSIINDFSRTLHDGYITKGASGDTGTDIFLFFFLFLFPGLVLYGLGKRREKKPQ